MRDFTDADRQKKRGRIELPNNPDNLSPAALASLETAVQAAARDGLVACPAGWKVAKEAGISRLAVGVMIDRLGLRVTDCQLGCFKVGKTPFGGRATEPFTADVSARVEALREAGELSCSNTFALADELHVKPRSVAEAANVRGYKLSRCQLGCF